MPDQLGIGTMAQQGSTLIDLGEAAKPIEDFGTGAAKAGGAVIKAVANGAELPAWLLAFALVVLLIRVFFTSQATSSAPASAARRHSQCQTNVSPLSRPRIHRGQGFVDEIR